MGKTIFFSGLSALSTLLYVFLLSEVVNAQIISPSGVEVKFSYTTTIEVPADQPDSPEDQAQFHAQHMFGILHSPELMATYGIEANSEGGIGAPRARMKIKILDSKTVRNKVILTYSNIGQMILNKKAAAAILNAGSFVLPLPTNPYKIYKKSCTDSHYAGLGDFWYFYDPFRYGCESLSQAPLATNVEFTIELFKAKKMDQTARLPYLRGDNGNGDFFSIYMIHGFSKGLKVKDDDGRMNFNEFDDYMRAQGFVESRESSGTIVPLHIFKKEIILDNGKKIKVEVKHMLVDTDIASKSVAFAQFFKQAVETADVILYGGHSGLGGFLDISSLEAKAGKFKFNPKKKQLFYFDSCSSYSYYLETFAAEKTKAKIDIITNGLTSYFETSNAVLVQLMNHLLTTKTEDTPWSKILGDMEKVLDGDSYLLNVGGI
ncbi:MAG: hypothetical protein H7256_14470 [Bdellovibrio sp.]|nr:hypothetical protein [Bdellovibrio sp.]